MYLCNLVLSCKDNPIVRQANSYICWYSHLGSIYTSNCPTNSSLKAALVQQIYLNLVKQTFEAVSIKVANTIFCLNHFLWYIWTFFVIVCHWHNARFPKRWKIAMIDCPGRCVCMGGGRGMGFHTKNIHMLGLPKRSLFKVYFLTTLVSLSVYFL